MAENSKIEWCHHTFSPWEGCAKVSPGCKNCYAESQHNFYYSALGQEGQPGTCWGVGSPRLARAESYWKQPLKWNAAAKTAGERPRVFPSMCDVFEEQSATSQLFAGQTAQVPSGPGKTRTVRFVDIATERLRLLRLIYDTPHLDWLLLTKRPEHIASALDAAYVTAIEQYINGDEKSNDFAGWLFDWADGMKVPANVWLGTSVENQEQADARIPHLLAAPAAVRFLSCEPLLGPVDLKSAAAFGTWVPPGHRSFAGRYDGSRMDWVIVGGESGHSARPMHPKWAQDLRDQCVTAGVAFHFKQFGEYIENEQAYKMFRAQNRSIPIMARLGYKYVELDADTLLWRFGKHEAGRHLDGRTWDELPSVGKGVARG